LILSVQVNVNTLECAKGYKYGLDQTSMCGLTFEPFVNATMALIVDKSKAAGDDAIVVQDTGNAADIIKQVCLCHFHH
jgi:hypothetical protein